MQSNKLFYETYHYPGFEFRKTTLASIKSALQPANQKIPLQSQNKLICTRILYPEYRLNPS